MNEIIKVNYDSEQPTVSARELHEKLEIGTKFTTWFERMCEYGFSSGKEFFPKLGETSEIGGRPPLDYDLTIRCAKEICMIQRTEIGRTIRNYFLDLEDAWNTPDQVMARALKLADITISKLTQEKKALEAEAVEMNKAIADMKPKADYVDIILQSKSTVLTTQIAQDYGMSAKTFNKKLEELGIQHKVGGQWILYAKYLGKGYVQSKTIEFTRSNGVVDTRMQTEWTTKGRMFLYEELKKHGIYPLIERAA